MKNRIAIAAGIVVALGVGVAAGYFGAKKQLEKKYEERITQELEDAKRVYQQIYKKGDFQTPETTTKALGVQAPAPAVKVEKELVGTALRAMGNYHKGTGSQLVETVAKNIFKDRVVHEEPSEEDLRNRTEEAPYIISLTEFQTNESEYQQLEFTYYAGDDALVDEQEELVDDPDDVVGENNLREFGRYSGDPRIVYVRNDAKELEFCITMNENSYASVIGLGG